MHVELEGSQRARVATTCKLNLWLDVLGRREDGYHELRSLFHELRFGDDLALELAPAAENAVRFSSDDRELEGDPTNLCVRAAELWLAQRAPKEHFRISMRLEKRLPAGGGIGGGSGDAVAVLLGLEHLRRGTAGRAELHELALALGSDCPFFLSGGTALVTGRGEHVAPHVHPLLADLEARVVLVMPGLRVPTREVFARYAAQAGRRFDHPALEELLAARDWALLQRACWNRLEACSVEAEPRLLEVRRALERAWPLPPAMSGSGSTYFAFAASDGEARELAASARGALPRARVEVTPVAGVA